MITRELRRACDFDGPKMRSRFDACVTRLQGTCQCQHTPELSRKLLLGHLHKILPYATEQQIAKNLG